LVSLILKKKMAATVSAWSKPGAWAPDSEEHEAELLQNNNNNVVESNNRRRKPKTLSLAELIAKTFSSFTHQDPVDLLTGPRQRTAEELERDWTHIGGGFGSYDGDRDSNRDSQPSRADEIDNCAAVLVRNLPLGMALIERIVLKEMVFLIPSPRLMNLIRVLCQMVGVHLG
jgi:hypothetical protein